MKIKVWFEAEEYVLYFRHRGISIRVDALAWTAAWGICDLPFIGNGNHEVIHAALEDIVRHGLSDGETYPLTVEAPEGVQEIFTGSACLPIDSVASAKGGEIRLLASGVHYFPKVGEKVCLLSPYQMNDKATAFRYWVMLTRKGDLATPDVWIGE